MPLDILDSKCPVIGLEFGRVLRETFAAVGSSELLPSSMTSGSLFRRFDAISCSFLNSSGDERRGGRPPKLFLAICLVR
jgi:hypothetical protein